MTARRQSPMAIKAIRDQLAAIVEDLFTNNGPLVTHQQLATQHAIRNLSLSALDDVLRHGPVAVHRLREAGWAIVPATERIGSLSPTSSVADIADMVAGAGAGGNRIGWYNPTGPDDLLWTFYLGHQVKAGTHLIFHAAVQVEANPALTGQDLLKDISDRSKPAAPVSGSEKTLLLEDAKRKVKP